MNTNDQAFVIETREHLVGLLAEAAEIEHHLMCCYLYAAFQGTPLTRNTSHSLLGVDRALEGFRQK